MDRTITLENVRTASDVTMPTRLKDGGVAIDWTTLTDIKAWLYSDAQRAMAGRCTLRLDESAPDVLVCEYSALKPQYPGVNRLIVQAKYMGRVKTYDKPVLNFVPRTAQVAGEQIVLEDPIVNVEIEVEDVTSSILDSILAACVKATEEAQEVVDVGRGPRGYSAYQVAVQNGFVGTEDDWLESLVGPGGKSAYQLAVDQGYDGTLPEWLASLHGADGDSAYEVAVQEGFVGTKAQWLASLVGPQGLSAYQVAVVDGYQGTVSEWLASLVGPVGPTPIFTIGTVETVDEGVPASVTITGTPSAPVLNLKLPRGLQGNPGSSQEYPFELVNNETTNDATKAHTAAGAKRLKDELTQLEAKVSGFAWTEGKYLNSSGNEVADAAWGYTDFIPYTQGNDVLWKWGNAGSVPSGRTINFYKADKTYISGGYWSVSGQTGQKTISAAGIASDAGQAAYIRASFKLGEDASITIGNSVAWKNTKGIEYQVNKNTQAIGVLEETVEENTVIVETNEIPILDTLAGAYISNANGDLSTFNGYNTRVYDVEGLEKVLITLVKSTDLAAAKQYGFYSATSDFAAGNALLVGDSMGSSMSSGTTEVAVPTGAKRLLLVTYSDTITQSASSKETKSLVESVNALAEELGDKTTITQIEGISPVSSVSGKYIKSDGSFEEYEGYVADVYDVEGLEKVFITLSKVSGTASRQYAFYTSDTIFDASTAALVGPNSGSSSVVSGTTEVNVPEGAKSLLLINYPGYISQTASAPIKQDIKTVVLGLAATEERKMAVKFDGTDLLVAYLDGTTEYCYRFKKCLANDLFTFYLVGYRSVTRPLPSVEGIINEDGITAINRANSDNIGPISMNPGGYVGGNHLYNDTVKTAKTDTFTIFVDGKELADNDAHYCDTVSVRVVNTLYDPSVAPGEGATILTTPLATETEEYKITENNIQVSVSIQFVNNAPGRISNYYGMQSMCVSETGVLTPNGALASAWSLPSSTSFTKGEYPKFNRFIEKKDTAYYQSTYLIPNKAGNHGQIEDTDPIFTRGSTGKDYHQIAIGGLAAGRRIVWSGVYTFMKSVVADDANILAYWGIVNGKKCLFVASKQSCSVDIAFPSSLLFAPLSVVEKEGNIETENAFVDVAGVHIDATGTGSLILEISSMTD